MNFYNKGYYTTSFTLALVLLYTITLCSCQKVITLDLNSAAPALVVEGGITDQAGPCTIQLTKTVNFSESNTFPPFTGASVIINDNTGNTQTLVETTPGIYTASSLQGTIGKAYTLLITAGGKNYQAVSTLPAPVTIDTLVQLSSSGFGGGPGGEVSKFVAIAFTDPVGVENYYRIVEIINGVTVSNISITRDFGRDGTLITSNLRRTGEIKLQTGDSVTVQLQSIDKNVYEYYRTFNQSSGGAGFTSTTPANPTSNISNGALGYFSAYAVTTKKIVIQ
jgi:hypothetical protein